MTVSPPVTCEMEVSTGGKVTGGERREKETGEKPGEEEEVIVGGHCVNKKEL